MHYGKINLFLAKPFKQLEKYSSCFSSKCFRLQTITLQIGGKFPTIEVITIALNKTKTTVYKPYKTMQNSNFYGCPPEETEHVFGK